MGGAPGWAIDGLGDGPCAALIAEKDWSGTALGPLEGWPAGLRAVLGVMLRSPRPMALLWGEEGLVLHNEAFAAATGGLRPETTGARAREAWPKSAPLVSLLLERGLEGDTLALKGRELAVPRDGRSERVPLDLDSVPMAGPDGRPGGVLLTFDPVPKAIEPPAPPPAPRSPRDAGADPGEARMMDTIGQITGGFAHDFNNLLTPIVAGLDIIRRKLPDERSQRLISAALQSSERAATLVQRLLAFAGRQRLQPTAISPAGIVEGMRDLLDRSLGPLVELRLEVPPDLPAVFVDPNQLEVALLNLAANARDAMPSGGRVTVAAELVDTDDDPVPGLRPGRYVSLALSDSGVGMEPGTARRAIEPFFTTKAQGQGTGLGLSMVHGFATQSGGLFKLLSEKGRGTAAVLFLPVAQEGRATAGGPDADPSRRWTVLLVDDEELVRMSMAEGLRDLGYDVEDVGTAHEALEAVRMGFRPDVVVTDHIMPGMLGADLARELREMQPDLPILMITGYAQLGPDQTRGFHVMSKPFRQSDLAGRLAAMLSGEEKVVPLRTRAPPE
ncbi:response regulator [Rubellimicrobium aerolatum]|uniref:response regulator n=1 Tax=Rubellimicrobium aerolatum TaxID=490979 RepID=UPI001AE9D95A|nr:response regulator [Rubellimicrobium aerolatum]MBP1804650.1 signal transduction histidine kinase/CheY-like chemotaxis protein [Rubellimicrobium aerolatum]